MINAQTIMDVVKAQPKTLDTESILELRDLELALVGGGSGEVLF